MPFILIIPNEPARVDFPCETVVFMVLDHLTKHFEFEYILMVYDLCLRSFSYLKLILVCLDHPIIVHCLLGPPCVFTPYKSLHSRCQVCITLWGKIQVNL